MEELDDAVIYLQLQNTLSEVHIKEKPIEQELLELKPLFHTKGIFYKGKPPIELLSPFGGSQVTFFHELLSKEGKKARMFEQYINSETGYYRVSRRFNDTIIRKAVSSIKDEELEVFKLSYWPSVEQINKWSDFELFSYIKDSYRKFQETAR